MYYEVVVTVEPKRKALAEANEQLEIANTQLAAGIHSLTHSYSLT